MAKAEYRSAIRSRKRITRALADLLQEKPLNKITVTDVVRRAEINRGTFYAHYTDLPDVLHSLIASIFDQIRESAFSQTCPLREVPHVLLRAFQQILEGDIEFCRKVMDSSAAPLLEEQLVKLLQDYLLQNEETYSFGTHEQYVLTIRFCAGGLANLYRSWFAGELVISLEDLTTQAERLLDQLVLNNDPADPEKP